MNNNLEKNNEEKKNRGFMKKEIPGYVLFLIFIISNILGRLVGGIIGASLEFFSLICLLLSIVKFIQDRLPSKIKKDNI
jgi:hypothetical protein